MNENDMYSGPGERQDQEQPDRMLRVKLSEDAIADVRFILDYLELISPEEAVKLSIGIGATLLREMKRGSVVFVQDTSGARYKLVLGE